MQLVKCLECGKEFKLLVKHIICKHNMSVEDYKIKHPGCQLESKDISMKRWNSTKKFYQKEYGVDNPMHVESIKDKCEDNMRKTFQDKYGVSHPMKSEVVKKLYQESLLNKYGVDCIMRDKEIAKKQRKEYNKTCMKKYGVLNTFSCADIQRKARLSANIRPNNVELAIASEFPVLNYVGDGRMWINFDNGKRANPDFILGNKIVELFGDYWHSKIKTGKNASMHQRDVIEKYKDAGYSCLIIWENEIRNDFQNVKRKISEFIDKDCSSETTSKTPLETMDEDIVRPVQRCTETSRNVLST